MFWCCCEDEPTEFPVGFSRVSRWFYISSHNNASNVWNHAFATDGMYIGRSQFTNFEGTIFNTVRWVVIQQFLGPLKSQTIAEATLDLFYLRSAVLPAGPHQLRIFFNHSATSFPEGWETTFDANEPPETPDPLPGRSWLPVVTGALTTDLRIDVTARVQSIVNRSSFSTTSYLVAMIVLDYAATSNDTNVPERHWQGGHFSDPLQPLPDGSGFKQIHNFIEVFV